MSTLSDSLTDSPAGIALVLLLALGLGLIGAAWALWRRGRRRRDAGQRGIGALPVAPDDPGPELARAAGTYVATTSAGDWLDRIVVHGLDVRSPAVMTVAPGGVRLERDGAPEIWVPAFLVRDVRLARGMAGNIARQEDGLVVVTWNLGSRHFDTAFLPHRLDDRDILLAALRHLEPASGGAR